MRGPLKLLLAIVICIIIWFFATCYPTMDSKDREVVWVSIVMMAFFYDTVIYILSYALWEIKPVWAITYYPVLLPLKWIIKMADKYL